MSSQSNIHAADGCAPPSLPQPASIRAISRPKRQVRVWPQGPRETEEEQPKQQPVAAAATAALRRSGWRRSGVDQAQTKPFGRRRLVVRQTREVHHSRFRYPRRARLRRPNECALPGARKEKAPHMGMRGLRQFRAVVAYSNIVISRPAARRDRGHIRPCSRPPSELPCPRSGNGCPARRAHSPPVSPQPRSCCRCGSYLWQSD